MTYLPRRRLVLASSGAISSYTPWPGSQLPWDAEEEFSQSGKHDQFIGSQGADFTQELLYSGTAPNALQSSQSDHSASLDKPCDSHFSLQQATELHSATTANRPETCSVRDLPASHVAAINSLCLPLQEYTELHHLLTKGFPCAQAASAKERAMYKLADLRQVPSLWLDTADDISKLSVCVCRSCAYTVFHKEVATRRCVYLAMLQPFVQVPLPLCSTVVDTCVQDALNALQGVQLVHPSIIAACKVP